MFSRSQTFNEDSPAHYHNRLAAAVYTDPDAKNVVIYICIHITACLCGVEELTNRINYLEM